MVFKSQPCCAIIKNFHKDVIHFNLPCLTNFVRFHKVHSSNQTQYVTSQEFKNVLFWQANVNKLDQKRRLRFDKMDKIFSDLEVVPLFGDMQVTQQTLLTYLQQIQWGLKFRTSKFVQLPNILMLGFGMVWYSNGLFHFIC